MRRPGSRLIALLLLPALLATACTRPSAGGKRPLEDPAVSEPGPVAPPRTEEPAPADPAPAPGGCVPAHTAGRPPYGYLRAEANVTAGLCEAVVAVEGFYLNFSLPAHVTEEMALAALRVEGAPQPQRVGFTPSPEQASLMLTFGPGAEGEVVTVRLEGPIGQDGAPADLGFRLRLLPSPTVRAELKVGDGIWHARSSGGTVPREPLLIRFHFTGRPSREWVEQRVNEALAPHKDATTRTLFHLEWESEERLLLSLPEPPPRIWIDFSSVANDQGLAIRDAGLLLYTGTVPLLVALDPATGAEELLLKGAPEDVLDRFASPDGRWIALTALRGDSAYAEGLWLLEAGTGALRLTDLTPSYPDRFFWLENQLIVSVHRQVQAWDLTTHRASLFPSEAEHLTSLSPDGRYLAGFTLDYTREDPRTYLAPASIVIHDLQTHAEQRFPDVAQVGVPHKSTPPRMRMAWPDGWRPRSTAGLWQAPPAGSTCPPTGARSP